jgi:hypothetical protein
VITFCMPMGTSSKPPPQWWSTMNLAVLKNEASVLEDALDRHMSSGDLAAQPAPSAKRSFTTPEARESTSVTRLSFGIRAKLSLVSTGRLLWPVEDRERSRESGGVLQRVVLRRNPAQVARRVRTRNCER